MFVVVLICAAVHFGSVSRPGSGFGEVRAILTLLLLQLRRLFSSSDREEATGQSVAAAAAGGDGDDDDVDGQPAPAARLLSPSSLSAIG